VRLLKVFVISILMAGLLTGCGSEKNLCHSKRADFDKMYDLAVENLKAGKDSKSMRYEGMAVQLVIENRSCFPQDFADTIEEIHKSINSRK
jgi:hypothetical protein